MFIKSSYIIIIFLSANYKFMKLNCIILYNIIYIIVIRNNSHIQMLSFYFVFCFLFMKNSHIIRRKYNVIFNYILLDLHKYYFTIIVVERNRIGLKFDDTPWINYHNRNSFLLSIRFCNFWKLFNSKWRQPLTTTSGSSYCLQKKLIIIIYSFLMTFEIYA